MGIITITVPTSGSPRTAASVANPLNTIKNEFNGNIDNNNIKEGANIGWSKLAKAGSALVDIADTNMSSVATGNMIYRNASAKWVNLAIGAEGKVLKSVSGIPAWADESAAPTGALMGWVTDTPPSGWLLCDGAAVSRATYAALFTVIGTTYGVGDGSTTFNVPNTKGRVLVGKDAAQTEFDALAETGGAKTHTLVTGEMPAHTHAGDLYNASDEDNGRFGTGGGSDRSNATTGSTGGGGAHNNLQPYLVVNHIIKT